MNRFIPIALLSSLVAVGCSHDKKTEKEPATPSELTSPAQPTPIPATPVYTPSAEPAVTAAPAPTPAPAPKAAAKPVQAAKPAVTTAKPAASVSSKVYVVKKGDSLSEIAHAHNTTVKKLMALNPAIKSADKIEVGQKIKLP